MNQSEREETQLDSAETYVSKVVEYEDAPDECTIWPSGESDRTAPTRWLTAKGDAFVPLSEMR